MVNINNLSYDSNDSATNKIPLVKQRGEVEKYQATSVYLPESLLRRLRVYKATHGGLMKVFIANALEEWLDKHENE